MMIDEKTKGLTTNDTLIDKSACILIPRGIAADTR